MAMCAIAYIRDSWSGSPSGDIQAAWAASPAFAFQSVTASAWASDDQLQRRKTRVKIPIPYVFIRPPFSLLRWQAALTSRSFRDVSFLSCGVPPIPLFLIIFVNPFLCHFLLLQKIGVGRKNP